MLKYKLNCRFDVVFNYGHNWEGLCDHSLKKKNLHFDFLKLMQLISNFYVISMTIYDAIANQMGQIVM